MAYEEFTNSALVTRYDDVYLVAGARTPFADYNGVLRDVNPIDMGIFAARALFERRDEGIISAQAVGLRYFPASADVTDDGKAAVFIPGIKSVDDIAAIAVKQPGKPLVWRRVTVTRSQN